MSRREIREWQLWSGPKIAQSLDSYWQKDIFDEQKDHVRTALAAVRKADPWALSLLDFGCGTGRYVPIVKRLGFEYTGVDITEEMLVVARERYPGTVFEADDIFGSTRPNGSYDVVMSANVIVHLPEFNRPFATLYRRAKRYVVIKLCYLTRRKGIIWKLFREPESYIQRNQQGFIEHFFNLRTVTDHITSTYQPGSISMDLFASGQSISDFQVVLIVAKPGVPRIA